MTTPLPEPTLSFSPSELFALASLLGGEMLIGVPDPFPGWLTEEILEAMDTARQDLANRNHLTLQPDGQVVMDVMTAAHVGTLVEPKSVFLLTITVHGQASRQLSFYHRPPLTVMLEGREEQLRLQILPATAAILEQVCETWGLEAQGPAKTQTFCLKQSALQLAQEAVASGMEGVRARLGEAGLTAAEAAGLATTLISPLRNGALVAMKSARNTWEVGGLGMLEGENGLWLLRSFTRQQEDWVEFIPSSAEKLSSEIEALISRFLPATETEPWKV